MNMNINEMVIKHCPYCDSLCLISQNKIDTERAAGKTVEIACHQCTKQFSLDGDNLKDIGVGRAANIKLYHCPSCQKPITVPNLLPDLMGADLFCPLCDEKVDVKQIIQEQKATADNSVSQQIKPVEKPKTSYAPLYILLIFSILALGFWAKESGQLPIDHWIRILN